MTPLNLASLLACLCLPAAAAAAADVEQEGGFKSANVGDSLTLRCFHGGAAALFLWYKQTAGRRPRLISTFYKYDQAGTFLEEFRNDPRFSLETTDGNYHLTMSDLRLSDSATYYCVSCNAYKFEFADGATVSVKASGRDVPAGVVPLNCSVHAGSCVGEHAVHWFGGSRPGIVHARGGDAGDSCEAKPETPACFYDLSPQKQSGSGAETLGCAVLACGRMVFGDGAAVDAENEVNSPGALVYFLSVALIFTNIMVVLTAFSIWKVMERNPCQPTESTSSAPPRADAEGGPDAESLHYAALSANLPDGSRKQRSTTWNECVYSSVKR